MPVALVFATTGAERKPREPPITQKSAGKLVEILRKEGMIMVSVESLVAMIGLCFTIFGLGCELGYIIGRNTKK